MKKIIFAAVSALLVCTVCFGQEKTSEEYKQRCNLLAGRLGITGVGIETVINHWEEDYPDDVEMLTAKFNYYFAKSQSSKVVEKNQKKFLGAEPTLTLKDSLGNPKSYFEETFYDDSLFAIASQAMDKAIRLNPRCLELRFAKITSLIAFEKESPDMALSTLKSLIDFTYTSNYVWTYGGDLVDNGFFVDAVQEYCYSLFLTNTPVSQEGFREVSEKMLKYNPDRTEFMSNIGSYYLTVKNDTKSALKYYNKVLKYNPIDYAAIKNCVIIAKKNQDVKLEKKYLPMLANVSPDENEKTSARARLELLNKK